jgi:phosphomannomutase
MSQSIKFGTDGWRAIIADQFTFSNVERVAYAVGKYVQEAYHTDGHKLPMLVGYDTRFLADEFALRAARVLNGLGIPAKLTSRDVPTPAIAFNVQLEPTAGALQFTASHNPPQYCGIKYIPHYAGPATNEITAKIVSHLEDLPAAYMAPQVDIERLDPQPPYLAALEKLVDLDRIGSSGLRIACDTVYSTSRGYLDDLLRKSGVQLKVLHNWRDPLFGGGMPEPKPEYLKELMKVIKDEKFDVGLATDGDADRFGVIDEAGMFMAPNHLLALLTKHLVKNRGIRGALVRTVATSHLLDRIAEMYGLELIETPVGFKYIGEVMRHQDVLIGGEESGGVSIKGHIPEKDGILANLLLVEMMAYEKKPLSEIWKELVKEAGLQLYGRRGDLHLNTLTQRGLMERLQSNPPSKIGGQTVSKIGRDDGLKFYLDEGNWMLVRPSGTEPVVRLHFEGSSPERLERIVTDFNAQVKEILKELEPGSRVHV